MNVASFHEGEGLSVVVSDPLVWATRASRGNVAPLLSSYGHESDTHCGYRAASFTIGDRLTQLEEWYARGLGRHVEVYGPGLGEVWEGFVNSVALNAGGLSAVRGPLVEVVNRAVVTYAPLDITADPPATGPERETPGADDADSQTRYGIWETVFSAGSRYDGGTPPLPEQIRDTLIGDRREPETTEALNPGGGQEPNVSIECLGYWAWLAAYVFNDATAGTRTITAKLETALAADPNGIISTDYDRLVANNALVAATERDNKTAWDVIQSLTASGDGTNYDRWTFGLYDGRVAHHAPMPSDTAYVHRLSDPAQRIETPSGVEVARWDVRPARWLFIPDFLIGRVMPTTDIRRDPRYLFVESVRYTAPWGIEINGAKLASLPQLLAQQMLGGL